MSLQVSAEDCQDYDVVLDRMRTINTNTVQGLFPIMQVTIFCTRTLYEFDFSVAQTILQHCC